MFLFLFFVDVLAMILFFLSFKKKLNIEIPQKSSKILSFPLFFLLFPLPTFISLQYPEI